MYPYNNYRPTYGQVYSRTNPPLRSQPKYQSNGFNNTQLQTVRSRGVINSCNVLRQKGEHISSFELRNMLNDVFYELNNLHDKKQRFTNLKDIVDALAYVPRSTIASIYPHQFLSLLEEPMIQILQKYANGIGLNQDEAKMFRHITKLSKSALSEVHDPNQYPPSMTHPALLDLICQCLINMTKSDRSFDQQNDQEAKSFFLLLTGYDDYQKDIANNKNFNQDKLVQLLDPIVQCLSSQQYINAFEDIQINRKPMTKTDKFFLVRCPTFLTNYNGSRLDEATNKLLSTMLPKYTFVLNRLIPLAYQWNPQTTRAVTQMLKIVNQGPTSEKIVTNHISFIDNILQILNVPKFHSHLKNNLISRETNLIYTVTDLLVHMINDSPILTHIKQKKITPSLLRLTSAPYEPLVYNVYTLLAYTTTDDDIKSMHNPGALLSSVMRALNTNINRKTDNQDQVAQLLETLKGLAQHDQLKEEILKQNALPFLIECTSRLNQTALPLLFETLWTTSFSQSVADVLRSNAQLMEKIQTISRTTDNEPLKKATDGLVWKLVKEPALLEKIAKRREEGDEEGEETIVTKEVIIGEDGKEKVVTTTRRASLFQTERVFQYDMMISYCHADKDLIIKIHKFLLDQGFKIWIDLNNMFGPAMAAMAEAVENSEFVLLCMSESYKNSTYCQAEAEYAFGCKRRLVPLIVRKGYKADGWLGFMIGSRIYVDYGTFDFDTACGKLMDELSRQRKRPLPSKATTSTTIETTTKTEKSVEESNTSLRLPAAYMKRKPERHFRKKYIHIWKPDDVLDFLFSHELYEFMPLCEKMDGQALLQLYKMCSARHNRTYTILNDEIKEKHNILLPIGTYTRFLSITGTIVPRPPPKTVEPFINLKPIIMPSPQPIMLITQQQPPPLQPLMLMPPQPPSLPRIENSSSGYDILVTSNAPPGDVLKMVERVGSQWHLKNSRLF